MKQLFRTNAMTLVELLLSVFLLSVVILAGVSIEMGARRIFRSAENETSLSSELSSIFTFVSKDINRGIGSNFTPVYDYTTVSGEPLYRIRVDSNNNSLADDIGAGNDSWVAYRFRGSPTWKLLRYRNYTNSSSANETLSNRIIYFNITPPVNGSSTVFVQIKKDPNSVFSALNPNITINSSVSYRSASFN